MGKVMELENLLQVLDKYRRNKTIVFTNGCFDVLHQGHFSYLREARQMGDMLIVGLNSDRSVRRLKGKGRPVNDQATRCRNLAKLDYVDYIVMFYQDTPRHLLRKIKPDVLVKGGTYRLDQVVGRDIVESYGGQVRLAKYLPGYSSTKIIDSGER